MFAKKASPKKMTTLSEKEIQERLYGFYHQSDMVGEPRPKDPSGTLKDPARTQVIDQPVPPVVPSARPLVPEKIEQEFKSVGLKAPLTSKLQPAVTPREPGFQQVILAKLQAAFGQVVVILKKVPLTYYAVAGTSLVLIVLFFQMVTLGFRRMHAAHRVKPAAQQVASPVRSDVSQPAEAPRGLSAESADSKNETPEALTPPTPPVVQAAKAYTVQLCLSDNVAASQKLIDGLKAKGYEAYYRKIRSSHGNELFQIFVGRYPSSSDAQATLKTLRQDSEFKGYDDSFVRLA